MANHGHLACNAGPAVLSGQVPHLLQQQCYHDKDEDADTDMGSAQCGQSMLPEEPWMSLTSRTRFTDFILQSTEI